MTALPRLVGTIFRCSVTSATYLREREAHLLAVLSELEELKRTRNREERVELWIWRSFDWRLVMRAYVPLFHAELCLMRSRYRECGYATARVKYRKNGGWLL